MTIPITLLDAVESVVYDCRIHNLSTDLTISDRIVFDLECCSQSICRYISTIARPSTEYNLLHDLNECISYMLVEWEAKLHLIESNEGNRVPCYGRPRKVVNMELVSECYHFSFMVILIFISYGHCFQVGGMEL